MKNLLARVLAALSLSFVLPISCGGDSVQAPPGGAQELCKSDSDCKSASAPLCDGFEGCVACVLDAHCAEGHRCEEHVCVAQQACATSQDCTEASKPICNFVLGACAECVFGADCGPNAICNQGKCEAVTPCVNSRDCPSEQVCDRDLSYCVECISDGDCAETHTCVSNECVVRCDSDKDCLTAGELCNREHGYCVACVEDVDCPELYHCDSGSCNVDVCLAENSTCVGNLNAREVCNENGSATTLVNCSYGSTCVPVGDRAACTSWTCPPGTATCSPDNTHLLICDADGLGGTISGDCSGAGGVCENGSCANVVCDAGAIFCQGQAVYQCNGLGTAYTSIQVCSSTYHCDADAGGCTLNKCFPNSPTCDGNILKTCNENGSGYDQAAETDCTETGSVCWNGECQPQVCNPSANYCMSGHVYACLNNGSAAQIYDACSGSEFCEDAQCKQRVCTPNQPTCVGEMTGLCNALGSAVDTSQGTDCAGQVDKDCWNGSCLDTVCEPTEGRFCQDNVVRNCTNNGTSSTVYHTCSSAQYCNDTVGSAVCSPKVCTPDTLTCSGNTVRLCNAQGSGFQEGGTDCESNELCVSGSCLPVICTANAYYCQNGNVQRCGADGTTSSLIDTCTLNEFCEAGATSCRADLCTANQATCDGPLVATCAADGSGPLDDGVACLSGQTCAGGACLDVFCTPGNQYCEGNFRRTCNATGTGYSSSVTCAASDYCSQETPTTTACRFDICNPGIATCDGETVAVCGADGGSYINQTTNCGATDMLCTGSGCAASVTETVGGITTTATCANNRLGNRYAFGSARTLTEIKQYLNIPGTIQLTWVVYEVSGLSIDATYTKVFEKLTTSSGLQYHSSGEMAFDVVPGKFYVIGVRPAGTCTSYYGGVSGKAYLASSGYVFEREIESNSGTLSSTWLFTGLTFAFGQQLTFE